MIIISGKMISAKQRLSFRSDFMCGTLPSPATSLQVPFFQILVPTVDTVRYSYLVKNLVAARKPVLLNGLSGTGKSVVMWETLYGATEELSLQLIGIQFSAQTSSARTQEMIEAKLKASPPSPSGCHDTVEEMCSLQRLGFAHHTFQRTGAANQTLSLLNVTDKPENSHVKYFSISIVS